MAERMAVEFEEDDYFSEPDYDRLTDDELDELYNFGQLSTASQRKKSLVKKAENVGELLLDFEDDDWVELNFDADFDAGYDDEFPMGDSL